jgi:hypothetical protein
MASESMQATIHILLPMIVGGVSAFFVYQIAHADAFGKHGRKESTSNKLLLERLEIFQSYTDKILLNILLPALFFVGLFSAKFNISELFILIASGFLIPFVTYQCSKLWFNRFARKGVGISHSWVPFLPATFGGGNRGTLLILVISLIFLPILGGNILPSQVVAIFALIDFGNFLFLLWMLKPALFKSVEQLVSASSAGSVKRSSNNETVDDAGLDVSAFLKYIGPGAVTVGVFAKVISEFLPPHLFGFMDREFYLLIGNYLSAIFGYLAFISLFIGIPRGKHEVAQQSAQIKIAQIISWLMAWLTARAVGVVCAYFSFRFFAGYLQTKDQLNFPDAIFIICFSIFIILPPSSVLPAYVNEAYRKATNDVAEMAVEVALGKLLLSRLLVWTNVAYVSLVLAMLLYLNK